jgi:hypothetical protein
MSTVLFHVKNGSMYCQLRIFEFADTLADELRHYYQGELLMYKHFQKCFLLFQYLKFLYEKKTHEIQHRIFVE